MSQEVGKHLMIALSARVAREPDTYVGPAMVALHRLLEKRRSEIIESE